MRFSRQEGIQIDLVEVQIDIEHRPWLGQQRLDRAAEVGMAQRAHEVGDAYHPAIPGYRRVEPKCAQRGGRLVHRVNRPDQAQRVERLAGNSKLHARLGLEVRDEARDREVAAERLRLDVSELDLGVILIAAGAMNILTGLFFRQPIPVQPMKAIAAVAITEGLTRDELMAAGLLMGVAILALSIVIEQVNRWVPKVVVRGIQLGVGLKLALKGLGDVGGLPLMGWDSLVSAALIAVLLLVLLTSRRQPALLYIFLLGFVLMFFESREAFQGLGFGLPRPHFGWPGGSALRLNIHGQNYIDREGVQPRNTENPWISASADLESEEWERARKVREALAISIDRQAIVDNILECE